MNLFKKTIEFFKEMGSAYYDESANKIMNCREGSFVWLHERGHQLDAVKRVKTRSAETLMLYFTIISSAAQSPSAQVWCGIWIMLTTWWELSAWWYSIKTRVFQRGGLVDERGNFIKSVEGV